MLFQAQLGTVRQRADRLAELAGTIAEKVGVNTELAKQAGLYAKADLATGLVSELSSLQGVIGAEYARAAGKHEAVAVALENQYRTPSSPLTSDDQKVASCLVIADQVDKLAGYLGLGLEPSGSSDPFGLRKAVTTLIRVSENWKGDLPAYSTLLSASIGIYKIQGFELDQFKAEQSLSNIFRGRYEALFSDYRYDVINAAIPDNHAGVTNPTFVIERIKLVDELRADDTFVQTASRPINIVAAAKKKGEEVRDGNDFDTAGADTPDAKVLYDVLFPISGAGSDLKSHLLSLVVPINAFFDNNMIMAEDAKVRACRLHLANLAAKVILATGDFTKLEG